MNSFVSLVDLPSAETISYLARSLSLNGDVVSKLRAQEVDGRFLKEQYVQGYLCTTLARPPFSFPYGTCSKIDSWVQSSIREAEEYQISTAGPATKSSVFLEDIISRNDVWPNIGERISEIQLELDAQLRKSSKSSSAAWFHVVTSAQGDLHPTFLLWVLKT